MNIFLDVEQRTNDIVFSECVDNIQLIKVNNETTFDGAQIICLGLGIE